MAAWVVRGGAFEAEALSEGLMSVDWDIRQDVGDLAEDEIRQLLQQTYPNKRKNEITKYTQEIVSFRDKIEIGDVIVMPQSSTIAIGVASGEYRHLSERPMHMVGRPVKWLAQEIPRDSIGMDLKSGLAQRQTIYEIKSRDAENRLLAIARGESSPWDEFVRRAKAYVNTGKLEGEELGYKVEIAERLATVRTAVLGGAVNWPGAVLDALNNKGGQKGRGNLVDWREQSGLSKWFDDSPQEALLSLQSLWTPQEISPSDRIRGFTEQLPLEMIRSPGARTAVASVLLMGLDAWHYPPVRTATFNKVYALTDYPQPTRDAGEVERYEHAIGLLDKFIDEAYERGLNLQNRLEAQSVVWAVVGGRGDVDEGVEEETDNVHENLEDLANRLFLPVEFLEDILWLLDDKKQVIFQGSPGTGKTFVAQKLAKHLAKGDEERVTLVQFHPSYAYEDFVQGFRPILKDGQAGFALRNGPLLRASERARNDPDNDHYLIIDEINRGNLAKVFGELYFLLEYRDHAMTLQYSDEPFSLPDNLYIIGTMNTADRSIALVDLALRRRFHFMEFRSSESPIKDVLRKYLQREAPDMTWVANVVERANGLLDDRHAAIGPSYFMKENLDEDMVKMVWEHNVLPYIEERLIGQPERLAEFSLDRLWGIADGNRDVSVEDAEDDDC